MREKMRSWPLLVASLVALFGILFSIYLYKRVGTVEQTRLKNQFTRLARNQVEGIKVQLSKDIELLSSIQDLIRTYPSVNAEQFKEFTQGHIKRAPYIVALEWLPRISRSERNTFERKMRRRYPDFAIRELSPSHRNVVEAGSRDVYYPVTFVVPLKNHEENKRALGYDHGSDPQRVEAMSRARKTGEAIATSTQWLWRINKTSSKGNNPSKILGYVIYLPVFHRGPSNVSSERKLLGYISAVIRVRPQIKNALSFSVLQRYENVYIYEHAGESSEQLIYSSSSKGILDPEAQTSNTLQDSIGWRTTIQVANQSWTYIAIPKDRFIETYRGYEAWATLAAGLLMSFLFSGYLYQNLTSRQRIQQEVQERTRQLSLEKARFRAVAENAGEAIVTTDGDGYITLFNTAAEEIFQKDAGQVLGSHLTVLIPDLIATEAEQEDDVSSESGTPPDMNTLYDSMKGQFGYPPEIKGRRAGDELFPIDLSVGRWINEGRPFYTLIIRDITERKEKEQELKLFNDLINQSNDSIFVVNPQSGQIEDVNETACENLGYTYREILGMHVTEIEKSSTYDRYDGEDGFDLDGIRSSGEFLQEGSWEEHVREVADRESMIFECQLQRSDGTNFPVEMNVRYVTSDEKDFLVKVARDITERKRTEEKLRRHQKLLSESQKMAHLGSFEWNPHSDEITWSRELYRIFGTDPESTELSFESFLNRVHEDDRNRVRQTIAKAIEEGRDFEIEERIVRPDGEIRYLESKGEVTCDQNGTPERVRGICLDITERKQAEQQIRDMNERLEEQVHERTKELEQFVYAASHDLREPLRVLQNYTEFLNEDLKQPQDRVQEDLHFINQAAERMNRLVESLLKLSQVGRSKLDLKTMALSECVETALENLRMAIDDADAEIEFGDLPELQVDEALIVDLYQNLISNALKYAGDPPRKIRFTAEQRDDEWVLGVKDNGVGIEPEYQEDIFQPFVHLQEQQSKDGTGIGLSICKRIVKRHGGDIWVESEPGEGAHFLFTIHPQRTPEGTSMDISPWGTDPVEVTDARRVRSGIEDSG